MLHFLIKFLYKNYASELRWHFEDKLSDGKFICDLCNFTSLISIRADFRNVFHQEDLSRFTLVGKWTDSFEENYRIASTQRIDYEKDWTSFAAPQS